MLLSGAQGGSFPTAALPAAPVGDFRAIYDEHLALVFRTLRRFGVPDASLDDAAQDVFTVVHTKINDFEGRSALKTWIFGIARRVARNHRSKQGELPIEAGLEFSSESHALHKAASERVDKARLLWHAMRQLSDEQRELFLLVELEQFTLREAAELLGENQHTLTSRLKRTRKQLQGSLERLTSQENWREKCRS